MKRSELPLFKQHVLVDGAWRDAAGALAHGGFKQSGLGREGGRSGIDEYLETKYVNLGEPG